MNLNSPLFDRIRVKRDERREARPAHDSPRCEFPGCNAAGSHRAPMGRDREGEYFRFCIDHVKQYNQSYNYFKGMSDADVARYQKESVIGHRPTWTMGAKRGGGTDEPFVDPLGMFREPGRTRSPEEERRSRLGIAARKSLSTLGLDETADAGAIRARYKQLVKRLHPDANGGDRSREEKLREIIQAYKQLKSEKLA